MLDTKVTSRCVNDVLGDDSEKILKVMKEIAIPNELAYCANAHNSALVPQSTQRKAQEPDEHMNMVRKGHLPGQVPLKVYRAQSRSWIGFAPVPGL